MGNVNTPCKKDVVRITFLDFVKESGVQNNSYCLGSELYEQTTNGFYVNDFLNCLNGKYNKKFSSIEAVSDEQAQHNEKVLFIEEIASFLLSEKDKTTESFGRSIQSTLNITDNQVIGFVIKKANEQLKDPVPADSKTKFFAHECELCGTYYLQDRNSVKLHFIEGYCFLTQFQSDQPYTAKDLANQIKPLVREPIYNRR